MKLSDNTIKGLAKIQNENILTEGLFSKILDSVIFHISRNNEPEGNFYIITSIENLYLTNLNF